MMMHMLIIIITTIIKNIINNNSDLNCNYQECIINFITNTTVTRMKPK